MNTRRKLWHVGAGLILWLSFSSAHAQDAATPASAAPAPTAPAPTAPVPTAPVPTAQAPTAQAATSDGSANESTLTEEKQIEILAKSHADNIVKDVNNQSADTAEASGVRTPDAPAFAILGIAPSDIQKPTTPRDLAVTLATFVGKDAILEIPTSLAVEVAPYWLVPHDRLSYEKYVKLDWHQLARNLSLSLATSGEEGTTARMLAVGLRTQVAWSRDNAHQRCEEVSQALSQTLAMDLSDDEKKQVDTIAKAASGPEWDNTARKLKEEKVAALKDADPQTKDACNKLAAAQEFVVSAAGAVDWRFPDSQVSKQAAWASQLYWATGAINWSSASLLATARVRFDNGEMDWVGHVDGGGRFVLTHKNLAVGAEALLRSDFHGGSSTTQYRLGAQVEVLVKENNWLTVSFAKDFGDALVSLANFSTSFGDAKVTK